MSAGLARSVALALLFACTPDAQTEPAAQEANRQTPSAPVAAPVSLAAVPPPIVPLPEPEFVTAPGHLEGGHLYVTTRPRRLQEFVRALPIAAERAAVVAILREELGLSLGSIDDLGLDPEAAMTATLLRPVAPQMAAVREQVQQIAAVQGGDPAATPPLSPELLRAAASLTYHNRLHIPVRDPEVLLRVVREQQRAGGLCRRLPHDACLASERTTVLLRRDDGAVIVDAFLQPYPHPDAGDEDSRAEAALAAMEVRPARHAALAALAGDVGLYIHGATIPALSDIFELGELVETLAITPSGQRRAVIDDALAHQAAVLRLRDTRRLFTGLSVSAALDPSDVRVDLSWEPADLTAAQQVEQLFAPAGGGLPGPSRAALCDGALLCWQLPPLPALAGFEGLALGDYASHDTLGPTIAAGGQFGLTVIAVETWPNQLGAWQRWSRGHGRDPGIARTLFELVGAVQGAGGSIRAGGGDVKRAKVIYARLNRQELGLVRSIASVAGAKFEDLPEGGLQHRLAAAAGQDGMTAFLASEPDEQTGWLVGADHLDGARWLLTAAPREFNTAPSFFVGSDDLAGLLAEYGPAGAANFAAWATGRKLTAIVELNRARPRIQISVTRSVP